MVQKLALITFGVVTAVAFLAIGEGMLRLFGVGTEALYGDPFVGFAAGRDLFGETTLESGERGYATREEKLPYFNYQEFPLTKAPETFRVFTLGGSTTAGRPYDDRVSFSAWMRLYLAEMDPTRRWEVINAGAVSYASYRIVLLMKELVRYSPDLFVVYTGHNEFLEERAYPPMIHRRPALKRSWIWLNGLRSYSLGRKLFQDLRRSKTRRFELAAEVATKPDDWTGIERYRRDEELKRSIVAHFEYNLQQMAAIAARHDVEIVFIRPVSNLKDFSPFKSEHGDDISPKEQAFIGDLLDRGRRLLESGDTSPALTSLTEAAGRDPLYAETHFLLGHAQLTSGQIGAAERSLVRAKELDVAPLRALEAMVELVGAVARRRGAPVIDLPARLRQDSTGLYGHPILGSEHLLDHVHLDLPVHSMVAEDVIGVMRSKGQVEVAAGWSQERRRVIYERALASLDRRYYAERDLNLAKVLGWAGKTIEAEEPLRRAASVLTDDPEVPLNLGVLLQKQGRFPEAAVALERALELDGGSANAHFNLGAVYAQLGRIDEGVTQLERAIELRPGYPEALYNLGVLLGRSEQPERALAVLEQAVEQHPKRAEIHNQIGVVNGRLERWENAARAFETVLELDPDSAAGLRGLGSAKAHSGLLEEGEALLHRSLALDPSQAETHFELGWTMVRSGNVDQAIRAYERAIAADPNYAKAHNNLGILLAGKDDRNDLGRAIRAFLRATEIHPGYAEAQFNLGVAYDAAGRVSEAIQAITRAAEIEPGNARFQLALGLMLWQSGERSRARSHLVRAERGGEVIPATIRQAM
ncbi:MAG: tetratricopeptide repeat protein [Acidobacteriota bacterium]|nr:tetratricopeptide repeat protein [Acidobacteriota bacterium]